NFMPRIGLAYQLDRNTVVRAGYGIYFVPYGQRFLAAEGAVPGFDTNTISIASPDGVRFNRTLDNIFPDGLAAAAGSSGGLSTFLGQGATIPAYRNNPNGYNQRWQLSVQRRIGGVYVLEARYVGNRTIKMPLARSRNALPIEYLSRSPERDQPRIDYLTTRVNNPFFGIPGVAGNLSSASQVGYSDLLTPFPQFTNITVQEPQGWSTYHALQVEFQRRYSNGLSFQTGYTFAKTMDGLSFLNAADPRPEKVISELDRPHIWRLLGQYELPFARRNPILGGWRMQGITFFQSGNPINFGNVIYRGDIHAIRTEGQTPDRLFNVDAGFERNSALQLQSNLRTFPSRLAGVRMGNAWNTDFSVIKSVKVKERFEGQFRAEAYNLFNQHFIQGAVDTSPVSRTFGSSVAASGPRTLQLGLKVVF
ncbi:MAG: hypothetical protein ABIZ80_03570, partial [Bryobacteraceae bacterium]